MSESDHGIKEEDVDLGPLPDPAVPLVPSLADVPEPDDLHSPEDEPHDNGDSDVSIEEADLGGEALPEDDS